jgi:hypothetical protein
MSRDHNLFFCGLLFFFKGTASNTKDTLQENAEGFPLHAGRVGQAFEEFPRRNHEQRIPQQGPPLSTDRSSHTTSAIELWQI